MYMLLQGVQKLHVETIQATQGRTSQQVLLAELSVIVENPSGCA